MKKIELITAWGTSRKSGQRIYMHEHNFYELVYYCNGEGITTVGEEQYAISKNACILIPPFIPHDEYHQKDGYLFCIGFVCDEIFDAEMLRDYRGDIQTIVQTILQEVSEQQSLYHEMAELKLQELILQLKRQKEKHTKPVTKDFEYVIGYLSQNYHERIVLKDIAEQLHLSYDYFQHRFKELVGESPQQFLIHRRVEAAERLLYEGNLSCTEIAGRCGFSNSAQFSTIFKKERNVSPRQYQRDCC